MARDSSRQQPRCSRSSLRRLSYAPLSQATTTTLASQSNESQGDRLVAESLSLPSRGKSSSQLRTWLRQQDKDAAPSAQEHDRDGEPKIPEEIENINLSFNDCQFEIITRDDNSTYFRISLPPEETDKRTPTLGPQSFIQLEDLDLTNQDAPFSFWIGQNMSEDDVGQAPVEYDLSKLKRSATIHTVDDFVEQIKDPDLSSEWHLWTLHLLTMIRIIMIAYDNDLKCKDGQPSSNLNTTGLQGKIRDLEQKLQQSRKAEQSMKRERDLIKARAEKAPTAKSSYSNALQNQVAKLKKQLEDRNAELNQSTDSYGVLSAENMKLITQLNTQKQAFARVQKQCDFKKKDADRLQEALFAEQDKAVLYLGERDEVLRSKEELETQLENQNITHKATVDNLIRDFQRIVPNYNPYHVLPRMPRSQWVTNERSASVARTGGFVPRALHRTDAPGTAPLEPPTMGRGNQPGDTNSLRSRMPAIDPYIAPARTQRGISATSREASTTAVSSTSRAGGRRRITLPELKEFNGSDEDAYKKWRQLLLQKMEIDLDLDEGYSKAERQALLRTKVSRDAYKLVKDQEMVTYID